MPAWSASHRSRVPKKYRSARLVQFLNAEAPMLVTPSGMAMAVRPLQASNALSPMMVTPSGMAMALRPLQP